MWGYFKKKTKEQQVLAPPKAEEAACNWCLFIPKDLSISSGIFFSSMGPGIKDCEKGILYIAPQKAMPKIRLERLSSYIAKEAILEYYGVYKRDPQTNGEGFLF